MSKLMSFVFVCVFGSIAAAGAVLQMQPQGMQRASAAALPASATANSSTLHPPAGGNTAMLYADTRGHFFADLYVQGIPIRALVDTGASLVSFSAEDAAKIGLRPDASMRTAQFSTANGIVSARVVRIPEMRLQGITVYDVEASIMPPGAMKGTLLGMSFMKKLTGYESRSTSLVLKK